MYFDLHRTTDDMIHMYSMPVRLMLLACLTMIDANVLIEWSAWVTKDRNGTECTYEVVWIITTRVSGFIIDSCCLIWIGLMLFMRMIESKVNLMNERQIKLDAHHNISSTMKDARCDRATSKHCMSIGEYFPRIERYRSALSKSSILRLVQWDQMELLLNEKLSTHPIGRFNRQCDNDRCLHPYLEKSALWQSAWPRRRSCHVLLHFIPADVHLLLLPFSMNSIARRLSTKIHCRH
jgi:hypothetical protein